MYTNTKILKMINKPKKQSLKKKIRKYLSKKGV